MGPQRQYEPGGEEKNSFPCQKLKAMCVLGSSLFSTDYFKKEIRKKSTLLLVINS
jgi:hypothetical protein